jgi:hypothetical protein
MFTKHLPKTLVIAILLSIVTAMPVFAQKSETVKPGRHRTGALTAVYRITHDGWIAQQAFEEMKNTISMMVSSAAQRSRRSLCLIFRAAEESGRSAVGN